MSAGLSLIGALCSPAARQGSLVLGLLVAGAAGGPMHCAPMCGGFVLGQAADRMARLPAAALCERRRITGALLLPYHLGRMLTYAGLGALAAGSAAVLGRAPWFGGVSAALLALAGLLFLGLAARRVAPLLPPARRPWAAGRLAGGRLAGGRLARALAALERSPPAWGRLVARLVAQFPGRIAGRSLPSGLLLGLTLGFLPCGFLYAALTAAAASLDPLTGAVGMAAFALGTVPALVVVGLAGQAAGRRWQAGLARLSPAVLAANAAVLLVLAWQAA